MSRPGAGRCATARPRAAQQDGGDDWYLSFDCATKSFAFALVRISDPSPGAQAAAARVVAAAAAKDVPETLAAVRALGAATRAAFHLAAGGAADLVPAKKDGDIPTIERIRAVQGYLRGPVAEALAAAAADGCPPPDSPALKVAIEYQMGVNAPARTVAAVVAAEYTAAHVFFVGPAFKNKLWYPSRPDLRHAVFVEKHSKLYTANKNHVKSLYFEHLAPLFAHPDLGIPPRLRKDFADSVVQVLGFRAFGDPERAPERF